MPIEAHPTALIHKTAEISDDVKIGPYAVIENDVVIGKNTVIGSHVLVAEKTRIGSECNIFKGAAIGAIPQDLKFHGEDTYLEIGNKTTIREFATLNRGTEDLGKTVVGSNCLVMAYVHIAHDCIIGNNVILANSVNMGGHVVIEDHVTVGGMTPIHQFVRIGAYAFLGGAYRVPKDVPPFVLAAGEPLIFRTLNLIGLKRRGFTSETIKAISKAYKQIYDKNLRLEEGLAILKSGESSLPEITQVIDFFENSSRGVIGAR